MSEGDASPAPIEMQAAVLREPGKPVRVETVLLDPPRRDEVVVRVGAAGVCHSDLHLADGRLGAGRWPMVLGHEGAGVVVAVGAGVNAPAPGDRVVFSLPACGSCRPCRSGQRTLCETAATCGVGGNLLDGTSRLRTADGTTLQHGLMIACFAEFAVVPAAGAVTLPGEVPLWQAALLGCGVMTGIGAVKRARVQVGTRACVIGCGGVGLQVITGLRLAGAGQIIAVDRHPEKLDRARRRGATHAVDASGAAELVPTVLDLSAGGVEHAFEVVGSAATIRVAWDVLCPGGTATVVGLAPRGVEVSLPAIEFLNEKTITGCYYGSADPHTAIGELVALVRDGHLDLGDVVSHIVSLDDVEAALDRLRREEGVRSVVVIDEGLAGAGVRPGALAGSAA
jgi:S-(hydroxymethyl)glutathione dehydrogenase / alcohol dehydrogenase